MNWENEGFILSKISLENSLTSFKLAVLTTKSFASDKFIIQGLRSAQV